MATTSAKPESDFLSLKQQIKSWSTELGFQDCGISNTQLAADEQHLDAWLAAGFHGTMDYMQRHGHKRSRPQKLVPGTLRVISVRMDYLAPDAEHPSTVLNQPDLAYISRYAMGRDYHKVIRARLQQLASRIEQQIGDFGYRVFVDSAPVLEKALARNSGLGWIGKHSNLIHPKTGSWFFLGEIYTDLPLPEDECFTDNHCGSCVACMDICPTQAIVAPYQVDARKCISYLTIELRDAIPVEFRKAIGNRIYGCDDCQLVCPWNKFARNSEEKDFRVRHGFDQPKLLELFQWSEAQFLQHTEGTAIRRIGYDCWLRNIAVALGNSTTTEELIKVLQQRLKDTSVMVQEHIVWALEQHGITNNE